MPEFHVGGSRLAAVAVLGLAGSAMAQAPAPALIQIDAGGASVPMEPYYSFLLPGEEQPGVMSGLRFPMTSRLEPGIFEGRSRQALDPRWLTQPIFVIAAEPDSLVWLQRNRAALHAMSATGVVVSAVNEEAFKIIQREAKGLPVAPALDPWLQDRLMAAGVNVVPVLIQIDGHASQELK